MIEAISSLLIIISRGSGVIALRATQKSKVRSQKLITRAFFPTETLRVTPVAVTHKAFGKVLTHMRSAILLLRS